MPKQVTMTSSALNLPLGTGSPLVTSERRKRTSDSVQGGLMNGLPPLPVDNTNADKNFYGADREGGQSVHESPLYSSIEQDRQ